jgi:hypothetical protein
MTGSKPIDRTKNGCGYMGICYRDDPDIYCHQCGILCKFPERNIPIEY